MVSAGEKTGKPTAAGVLNIIAGIIMAIWALLLLIAVIAIGSAGMTDIFDAADMPFVVSTAQTVLVIQLVIAVIFAVFTIIGGAFALQRRRWGWALAGSIIAIPAGLVVLGIISTILVSVSKDEFE